MIDSHKKLTMAEASEWVTNKYGFEVTVSNIAYLVQYGRVRKLSENGNTYVYLDDLYQYYEDRQSLQNSWKSQLGEDLNWDLSFENIKEKDRTKHVHRLHSYKGKFIPQLVEYFLDTHIDNYKKDRYFYPGDLILDPFCGSGTTLVQANELGIDAVGIDVSEFNSLLSNVKIKQHDILILEKEIAEITYALQEYVALNDWDEFEDELLVRLGEFNKLYFPSPDYKFKVRNKEFDQLTYAESKEDAFLPIYFELLKKYKLNVSPRNTASTFMGRWYLVPVKNEIDFVLNLVNGISDNQIKSVIKIILSRTVRSCRATTHLDLATLKEPVIMPYYCRKHFKICKPLFSIQRWWEEYASDTIARLREFNTLRTDTHQYCLTGDGRNINILEELQIQCLPLFQRVKNDKFKGIFSSPPYVGLIDYHDQHAYAYELFGFERRDTQEIGPLFMGKGHKAKQSYVEGITQVLKNCLPYLVDNFDIFLVANDQFNLYPTIAERSGLRIVNEFKRPVLNRTEKDKSAYSESIFHLKE